MSRIAIVFHSTYGHTKVQAEAVSRGASSVSGAEVLTLEASEAIGKLDLLDASDAIVFGSPTYMGSVSAKMKELFEASIERWFKLAWKDKVAGGFTNSSCFSGDKFNTLIDIATFAMQHGMIWVGTGLLPPFTDEGFRSIHGPGANALNRHGAWFGAMAASFEVEPGQAPPSGDIATAEHYGKRVAELAIRLRGTP
jgi:NAD(P)H dehydrogenase (quinone)